MCKGLKLCKPGLALILSGLGVACSGTVLAAEWQVKPRVDVVETYSDNIALAADDGVANDDYVTQLVPSVSVTAHGDRLKLDSIYSLQDIHYAHNSSRNQTHNQLQLGADAELVKDLFYLSADGQLSQQLLSLERGTAADNLNIDSGRSDVVTTHIEPSIKRRLGNYVDLGLAYSEGRVNYESDTVADGRLQERKFSLGRSRESTPLEWQLNYSQARQWAAETLTSEREQSAATVRYALFDHLSLVANGGREDGQISNSTTTYRSGSYWSAGLTWRPSSHLSLEAASGDRDRQASIMWAPGAKTSLSATYLDREVGVLASNAVTGSFRHATRRTLWTLTHIEEITSDAVLAVIDSRPVVWLDQNDEPIVINGEVQTIQRPVLGISTEHYRRESNQGTFTYTARRNALTLGINEERRHYELIGREREAQLHGGFISWRLRLSARASSDVQYSVNRNTDSITTANDIETNTLSWSLKSSLGKQITTGLELRRTEVDGGTAALSHSENRLSANVGAAF